MRDRARGWKPGPTTGTARTIGLSVLLGLISLCLPNRAWAHEASGGLILLLPTDFYATGAALAVAATFILLALVPQAPFHRFATSTVTLFRIPGDGGRLSLASTILLALLLMAGLAGSSDPLRNPLPLMVWTIGWITMTLACALFGNLWTALNPWTGLVDMFRRDFPVRATLPARIGYLIAILQFFVFIWIDLISTHAMDPEQLVQQVGLYWLFNFVGMMLFGKEEWCLRAEPLHVFFGFVGRVAPFRRAETGRLTLGLPGVHAVTRPPLSASGVAFVLLALAAGTFDGWSTTFHWMGLLGFNPLNYPGRSAVMWQNTAGLLATWALVWALYHGCVHLGARLAGAVEARAELAGRLAYSLLPIAVAYHGSHFLVRLLVDYQYVYQMISDPLRLGWNLFGTAHYHTTTSVFARPDSVLLIWNAQTAIITLGHVIGICIAHTIALDRLGSGGIPGGVFGGKAVASQVPLALFMVFYTAMGLYLLGSPRI